MTLKKQGFFADAMREAIGSARWG